MDSRVTRQDVALLAQVSGATVSRVYNAPELVDPATVQRVRQAAEQLGFVPDKHASALRRKNSNTILFLEIEDPQNYRWAEQRVYHSLYGDIIRALIHRVQQSMFTFQLVSLTSVDQIDNLKKQFAFSGVIGFDIDRQDWANALTSLQAPVVCCHHGNYLEGVGTVCTDNAEGGRMIARELIRQEKTKTAYITGLCDQVPSHLARKAGFSEILKPKQLFDHSLGYDQGYRTALNLRKAIMNNEIDSIACVNDLTALGVIKALEETGLRSSVLVCGYDNLPLVDILSSQIITVDAALPKLYVQAFDLIIRQINRNEKQLIKVLDPPVLIPHPSM